LQIVGAPSFFPTVWGWCKRWFDPITTSKIFVLGANDVKPTLSAFIDVANIPKRYGGELDFECGMLPVLDAPVLDVLTLSSPEDRSAAPMFLAAPVRWVDGDNGDLQALGVGSIDGKPRREIVATLHAHAAQRAFPGMSRQNTRSIIEPTVSRDATRQFVPPPVPPAPAGDRPVAAATPPPSGIAQPEASPVESAPVRVHPAPAPSPSPPLSGGGEPAFIQGEILPGPLPPPKQPVPPPVQRLGTEYYTPPIDVSEQKRL
jgi:hypothetical protein